MKILNMDLKHGHVELLVENDTDVWVLYTILGKNDLVTSKTTRDVKFESGSDRVAMVLTIRVENIEFQPFSDRLRIHGVVVEGPDDYGVKGRFHTLTVGVGDRVIVWKEKWLEHQVKRLIERRFLAKILITLFDHYSVCIALASDQGVRVLEEKDSGIPSRKDRVHLENLMKNYMDEIVNSILRYVDSIGVDIVLIGSPLDYAKKLRSVLKEKKRDIKVYVDHVSNGDCSSIREAISRDTFRELVRDAHLVEIQDVLEEFKKLLVEKPEYVAYGLDEVEKAAVNNAVSKLLVSEDLIRTYEYDIRVRVEKLMEEAYVRRAEIYVVPREHPVHIEIEGFGGVLALLRYPIYRSI